MIQKIKEMIIEAKSLRGHKGMGSITPMKGIHLEGAEIFLLLTRIRGRSIHLQLGTLDVVTAKGFILIKFVEFI